MAPIKNTRVILKKSVQPGEYPVAGENIAFDDSQTIDLDTTEVVDGQLLVKVINASLDPYMRGRMRPPEIWSYSAAFTPGEAIDGFALGEVIKTGDSKIPVGSKVVGLIQYNEYSIVGSDRVYVVPNLNVKPSTFIGVLGMPGQTAWLGLKEHSEMKKGEIAFVTTGAGAVGSLVIQLLKAAGLKVIGSAGSDDKVEYMKELGADVAFNYKTTSTEEILKKEGPIDVYWDNVGGETLDTVLMNMNINGRLVECGMASVYNSENYPLKNAMQIVARSLKIHGFIVSRTIGPLRDQFFQEIGPKVESGEIKFKEDVAQGWAATPEALVSMLKGGNKGKVVIQVA